MANSEEHASSVTSWDSLNNFGKISSDVQSHLILVYLSSACALVAAAVGAYLHIWFNIGGLLTFLGFLGILVLLVATSPDSYDDGDTEKRFGLLMISSLFQGATIGPLIALVIQFNLRILVSAFVGAAVAFVCFSAVAVLSMRRQNLYLGGLLCSSIAILFWLQFASSIFGGSTSTFKFELYFGLLIFLGYVVVDTQLIVGRADSGDMDFVKHSFELITIFGRWSCSSHDHDD